MANYTSDPNLIRGAGVAYKDWENVPGMYKGLEDLSKAGREMTKQAIKDKEKDEKRDEEDLAKLKIKNAKQEKEFKTAFGDAYIKLGSFTEPTDYNDAVDQLDAAKKDLFAAQNEVPPNQKGITAATIILNNLKADIDDTVDLRFAWGKAEEDGVGASNAMKASNYVGGNDGRDLGIVTKWMKQDYKITRNEENEKVYNFEQGDLPEGTKLVYTRKELEDIYIPRNYAAPLAYMELLEDYGNKTFIGEEVIRNKIKGVVPSSEKGLRAFVADKIGDKTFLERLDNDKNLRAEVNQTLANDPMFDTDGTPGISDAEFAAFKQAIVDPYSKVWQVDGEADMAKWEKHARPIVEDALYYGAVNQKNAVEVDEGEGDEHDINQIGK